MVKTKTESEDNVHWLKRQLSDIERRNPIIETRYYVVEVTPSQRYDAGDGHGGSMHMWSKEVLTKVSPYFRTKKAAVQWLEEHDPDDGKELQLMRQHKRRTITERWWNAHRIRY